MTRKIAILEDDLTMCSLLETLFTLEGYQVVILQPEDGSVILQQVNKENPSVLLFDVHLKYFNSIEITRKIRQSESGKNMLIVMVSGMDLRKDCLAAGANLFLLKPYMPEKLIDWVAEHLLIS
ncbi:MAG: response regulator [Anaerolineaceae bacterium]|nr:response regulator [Anaerolineaceae bacterium]